MSHKRLITAVALGATLLCSPAYATTVQVTEHLGSLDPLNFDSAGFSGQN
jgi:hypothetical protein